MRGHNICLLRNKKNKKKFLNYPQYPLLSGALTLKGIKMFLEEQCFPLKRRSHFEKAMYKFSRASNSMSQKLFSFVKWQRNTCGEPILL